MGLIESVSRLFGRARQEDAKGEIDCSPRPQPRSLLDLRIDVLPEEIALGVKYASRYSWQILPPLGWRRQESISGPAWPAPGSSPSVTFVSAQAKPPEQAMIKWHMLSVPETRASHEKLEELIFGSQVLSPEAVLAIEAPGLVAGMKVHKVERVELGGVVPGILVALRIEQLRGESPVLRYVVVFPDREVSTADGVLWFRESLQYTATEDSFYKYEPTAVESLKSFRHTASDDPAGPRQVFASSLTSVR